MSRINLVIVAAVLHWLPEQWKQNQVHIDLNCSNVPECASSNQSAVTDLHNLLHRRNWKDEPPVWQTSWHLVDGQGQLCSLGFICNAVYFNTLRFINCIVNKAEGNLSDFFIPVFLRIKMYVDHLVAMNQQWKAVMHI